MYELLTVSGLIIIAAGVAAKAKSLLFLATAGAASGLSQKVKRRLPTKLRWVTPFIGAAGGAGLMWTGTKLGVPGAEQIADGFAQAFGVGLDAGAVLAGSGASLLSNGAFAVVHGRTKDKLADGEERLDDYYAKRRELSEKLKAKVEHKPRERK